MNGNVLDRFRLDNKIDGGYTALLIALNPPGRRRVIAGTRFGQPHIDHGVDTYE